MPNIDDELAQLEEQARKTEDGQRFPAAAYAYVPDPEKPSTWKLRLWETLDKKVTVRQLGRAAAAFSPGGFRGQRVRIPAADVAKVKAKIRAAYRRLGVESEDIPRSLRESDQTIPHWVMESEPMERMMAATMLPLEEGAYDKAKGELTVTVIRPGFNTSKQTYYPKEVLERDGQVFAGLKMFADHGDDDSVHRWVGTVGEVWSDPDGSLKAKAQVIDPPFKEKLAALADSKLLPQMGISIRAIGEAVKSKVDGVTTRLVERLAKGRSVDFVTYPGAGGQVELFESDEGEGNDVDLIDEDGFRERRPDLVELIEAASKAKSQQEEGTKMPTQDVAEIQKQLDEAEKSKTDLEGQLATITTERDELKVQVKEAQQVAARAKVQEAVANADLPEPSKKRLVQQFEAVESAEKIEEMVEKAVTAEKQYLKDLAEAGKVKDLGESKKEEEDGQKALREALVKSHQLKGKTVEQATVLAEADMNRR